MSESRLLYNHVVDSLPDKQVRDVIRTHVDELEQQNKKLMESQKQKQIIRLCNRLDKAEQQNKQMLEALIEWRKTEFFESELAWQLWVNNFRTRVDNIIKSVTGKKIEEILTQEENDE